MLDALSDKNLLQWTRSTAALPPWVLPPNANTDQELLRAINGDTGEGTADNTVVRLGGHVVKKGKIMFLRNDTSWEIRLEGRYHFVDPKVSVLPRRFSLEETYAFSNFSRSLSRLLFLFFLSFFLSLSFFYLFFFFLSFFFSSLFL